MGLTAIKLAFAGNFENSVVCIIVATFLDGLDGRLARILQASSNFGAQLDSLVDSISFGVAPGIILYLWILHQFKLFGWAAVIIYTRALLYLDRHK